MTFTEFVKKVAESSQKEQIPETDTKYRFKEIMFEITRKCNLKCAHCLRGKMQPVSMSKEVIDKILEAASGIDIISLTGGEPFLEPDLIEYLVDKIIEKDFDVTHLATVTNGTILNDRGIRCAKAFDRFAEWRSQKDEGQKEWYCAIEVSNDQFHGSDVEKAVEFYKACTNHTLVSKQEHKNGEIVVSPYGNAQVNHLSKVVRVSDEIYRHRLFIDENNCVNCSVRLSHDGKLGFFDCNEWEIIDQNIIGDIMNESLEMILERNQWQEYQCREMKLINMCKRILLDYEEGTKNYKVAEATIQCYEMIKDKRNEIHKELPYLDYITICNLVDFMMDSFSSGKWLKYLYGDAAPERLTDEMLDNYFKMCVDRNVQNRKKGKGKAREVPFDASVEHYDFCVYGVNGI